MRYALPLVLRHLKYARHYSAGVVESPPAWKGKGKAKANYNVVDELESRGFVAALTHPELRGHVESKTCIYSGVDPSADSLHVGNLVALMGLLHFQLAGHKVLALVGGATGSIGDPSGRSTERRMLSKEVLEANVRGITAQVHRIFERAQSYLSRKRETLSEGASDPYLRSTLGETSERGEVQVVNNLDWFKGVGLLEFLRDVGKLARVNNMLARDSVRSRLDSESGISFTEFSYQLLQAYDFSILHQTHGCRIQLGGSDQWGNIVAGIDLIKRQKSPAVANSLRDLSGPSSHPTKDAETEDHSQVFGITLPLLTTESGEKFGKSAGNAVWLDPTKTSVSDFYQFFFRLPDSSIEQYLKLFTLLPVERIQSIMSNHDTNRSERSAQKVLAEEVTELVHGYDALRRSQSSAKLLFRTQLDILRSQHVLNLLVGEPIFHRVNWEDIKDVPLTKLAASCNLCKSRADANRAIKQNALTINGRPVNELAAHIKREDVLDNHLVVIKIGRKDHLVFFIDFQDLPRLESSEQSLQDALKWIESI